MRCLKVQRREPVGKECVEKPKGKKWNKVGERNKRKIQYPEHWRKSFEELRKPLRFKEGPNSGI